MLYTIRSSHFCILPPSLPLFGAAGRIAIPTEETRCKKLFILRILLPTCMVALACDLICCRFICDREHLLVLVYCPHTSTSLLYLHVAKTNSTPNAASVWPTTEALKTDVRPQQREGKSTIYQKTDRLEGCSTSPGLCLLCSTRALHSVVVLAKQHPIVRNHTHLVFPYIVVATVVMSFTSVLHKSIAESPTMKGNKNELF